MSDSENNSANDTVIEFGGVGYARGDGQWILEKLDLRVAKGEMLVLLGRSGSGKTTALKLINRLLVPDKGEVKVEGCSTVAWDPIQLRRRIGYAIQEVGLLPHLTVERNIGLVPRLEGWPQERIGKRVEELMRLVSLDTELQRRYPHEISGGQRQRVGMARALAGDPPMLLMDEPFGSLDPLTRAEIQREFKSVQQSLGKTVVFVTHDVHEALLLGTRIALLDGGHMVGLYTATEFLESRDELARAYVAAMR